MLKRWLAAIMFLTLLNPLSACAPDFARSPTAMARVLSTPSPAKLLETAPHGPAMVMEDGARLALRIWLPENDQPPKAVILALHGFNDYSRAFELPATSWARLGIATYAYDQRGFGANPHLGRWPGTPTLCHDLATALSLVQGRWPDIPVYLLGESMGGAEVLTAISGSCGTPMPRPAGIILVAPAVWGRHTMPVLNRLALWSASRLFPYARFTGAGFHVYASDNIPMLIQLGLDPYFIKATRVDAIDGLVDLMDTAYAAPPITDVPVLLLYGAHDELIPPAPLRDVARRFVAAPGAQVTLAFYRHGWHMLLRDREHEVVAADVSHWIFAPQAPLPSRADLLAPGFLAGRLPPPHMGPKIPPRHRPHERG